MTGNRVLYGDCRETLKTLPDQSVQCCITSPPYFGLRCYMEDGVRLKIDIPDDVRASIVAELESLGIVPLRHT